MRVRPAPLLRQRHPLAPEPPDLVEAQPRDLRLLRATDLRLWRALVRLKNEADAGDTDWFEADLRDVAWRARAGSYTTAKRALRRLRRAGLVATTRVIRPRWARTGKRVEEVNAMEQNRYLVPGECESRRGVHRVKLPRQQWESFVAGDGAEVVKPFTTDPGLIQYLVDWGAALCPRNPEAFGHTSLSDVDELDPLPGPSVISKREEKRSEEEGTSKKTAEAGSSFNSIQNRVEAKIKQENEQVVIHLVGLMGHDVDEDHPGAVAFGPRASRSVFLGPAVKRSLRPRPDRGPCPWMAPDQHGKTDPGIRWCPRAPATDRDRVRCVLDGYRRAVLEVYGQRWLHYCKGDLEKSKGYANLVACGEIMADQSVPPEHWAIWRLRWFKSQTRHANRPPPVWVVMSAKFVSEKGGWFRKEYELPVAVTVEDPVVTEQHYRNREAASLWEGRSREGSLMFLPRWYVEKRRAEIAQGHDSPHACWTNVPGSRWAADRIHEDGKIWAAPGALAKIDARRAGNF